MRTMFKATSCTFNTQHDRGSAADRYGYTHLQMCSPPPTHAHAGATLMSAFLVNTAIILTMAPAIIQFCASAFAVYGNRTDIFDIFGNQVGAAADRVWCRAMGFGVV